MAAQEGRFSEALSEYIWFHEHALEERPSLHGVRLSFALGYWLELAEQYPPARAALQSVLDEKTARLERGDQDWELFNDVTAINRESGKDERARRGACLEARTLRCHVLQSFWIKTLHVYSV